MYTHPGKKLNFMGNELGHFREWDEKKELDWGLMKYPFHDSFQKYFAELGRLYATEPASTMANTTRTALSGSPARAGTRACTPGCGRARARPSSV